ncbi:MAG: cell wall-binding repeat-containing protein [Desulfosporosinus sp.]|nr:cell wall-binding repeat-containing protein [Desulfosporosinus sp.]
MHTIKQVLLSAGVALGLILSQLLTPMAAVANTGISTVPLRLAGSDRYQTAVQIAEYGWKTATDNAVLAVGTDDHLVDALTAAPLAKVKSAPILLTQGETLNSSTAAELQRLKVKTVYLVTGLGVVSQNILDSLAKMNIQVVTLGGTDRFSTALNIAGQLGTPSQVALVTSGTNADALSMAPVAAAEGMPILLTDRDSLPPAVDNYLTTNKTSIQKSYVIGGTGVISDKVADRLPNSVRLSGSDRYSTNLAVIQQFSALLKPQYTFAANGEDIHLVDALTGAPLAALSNSLILLTGGSAFADTAQQLTGLGLSSNVIGLGGSGSITDNVLQTIEATIPAQTPASGGSTPASGGTTPPSTTATPSSSGGSGGGHGGNSNSSSTPNVVTTANVSTADELNVALANNSISTIIFTASFSASPTVTRALTMNFGAYTLTGDVAFNYTTSGTSVLTGKAGNRINGNLTVNTPNASFNNGVRVGGAVNVVNVEVGTWTESADGNTLIITDSDGAVITVTGNPGSVTIAEGANGSLTLNVNAGASVTNITSNAPIDIVVAAGATVTNITAATGSEGTTITNNGTTGTVTANVPINLVANVAPAQTVTGASGNVTVSGTERESVHQVQDLVAPTLSLTSMSALTDTTATLNFTTDEAGTYYYLVYTAASEAPDVAAIKAQGAAVAKGTAATLTGAKIVNVTGLTASTAYKAYLIVEDAAENTSTVSTIPVTTTEGVAVSSVEVKTAPTKLTYTTGDTLDLTGLVVTLTKSDSSTQDVALADFAANGITTVKANGDALVSGDTTVVITVNGKMVSQAITVSVPATLTSETLTVSNPTTTGFIVTLSPSLVGLTANNFKLLDSSNNPIAISAATTVDNGATYAISAVINAGLMYTVTPTKIGYNFVDSVTQTATATVTAPAAGNIVGTGFTASKIADPLGNTIVNVTVTDPNVAGVTVKGTAATQVTSNVWRAGFMGSVTVVGSDIILTTQSTPGAVNAINITTSNASKGLVGDAFVIVYLIKGMTATSVTADGKTMNYDNANGYYTVGLNSYNTTTNMVSVVVTTANGTQTLSLTVH